MKDRDGTNPLLSVVIPTRNRQQYARVAIRCILGIESQELELVVDDNSDSGELGESLGEELLDPRLRYTHDSSPLSFGENFVRALGKARGEYVCCIGDDDAVNLDIVAVCRWARLNDVDAITDNWRASFYWPDFTPDGETGRAGRLVIRRFVGKAEMVSSEAEVIRCVRSGGVGLQRLPKVYLGVVRRRCLEECLERIEQHQAGTCPDMYLAVAVASSIRRLCVLDFPVVIPGFSAVGAGMLIATRRHQGRLEDAPHLRARPTYEWPALIPRFYSVHTFYAESVWAALLATGRADLMRSFNLAFLYAVCLALYPEYRSAVWASVRRAKEEGKEDYLRFGLRQLSALTVGVASLVGKRLKAGSVLPGWAPVEAEVRGIRDSAGAARALGEYCNSVGRRFEAKHACY